MPCEAIKIKYCQTYINQIGTFPSAMISGMELGELYRANDLDILIAVIAVCSRLNEK